MLLLLLLLLLGGLPAGAQSFGGSSSSLNQRNESSQEPVRKMRRPQEPVEPKYHYPLWNGIMLGVDLFDPVARLLGQEYGGFEISAELNLLNRFFPIWEIGLGSAKSTPEDLNFTYRSKLALYNRIGMNYNFKYNDESPNFFHVGFRYGLSAFEYDITNISLVNDYWGESNTADILNQHSFAQWMEVVAGIRVKIVDEVFMGWSVRFKFLLSEKKNFLSNPWYIPGFGPESGSVGFSYSIFYRIPMGKKVYTPPAKQKKR